jgi:hypothetical protein
MQAALGCGIIHSGGASPRECANDDLVRGLRIGATFAGGIAFGDLDGDEDLFIGFLALPNEGWDYKPHPNEVWFNTTNE